MSLKKLLTVASVASVMAASSAAVMAQDVTIYNDKNGWEAGFAAMAEGASAASGLDVQVQLLAPTDKYQAFIQSSIAGGSAPPIFTWWNGKQLDTLAETGAIAPLDDAWDKAIADGNFSAAERDLVSVDGTAYATLLNVARWPTLYNKHAFEKAGIDAPPATWEELLDACEKLKAAGYVPFNAPGTNWMGLIWFSELMVRTDPDAFVAINNGTIPYNGPEVQKAFDIWTDFYAKGYFTDPREPESTKFFVNEEAAMWVMGEWIVGEISDKGLQPGEDFGAFIMPTVAPDVENSIIVEAAPIVVSKKALEENPDISKVVDYFMTPEATAAMAKFNGNLKAEPTTAIVEQVNELIAESNPRSIVRWWEAVPADLQGDLVSLLGAFMLNPTPENATDVMNDMEALSSEYWADQ